MRNLIRIRCVDPQANVVYVFQNGRTGEWDCARADGTLAGFDEAGADDEMMLRFALEDSDSPGRALQAMEDYGSKRYTYTLVTT